MPPGGGFALERTELGRQLNPPEECWRAYFQSGYVLAVRYRPDFLFQRMELALQFFGDDADVMGARAGPVDEKPDFAFRKPGLSNT